MGSRLKGVMPDSSTLIGSDFGISYEGSLREEARGTFYDTHGREPSEAELNSYISRGLEARDFFRRHREIPREKRKEQAILVG